MHGLSEKMALLAIFIVILSSCASTKKFVYLQDMVPGVDYPIEGRYEAKVQRDDRLSIPSPARRLNWLFLST